jgi:hypothetical protein
MIDAIRELDGEKVFIVYDNNSKVIGHLRYITNEHLELTTNNSTYHIHPKAIKVIRRYMD